jgi:hypothetical protein
MFSGAHYLAAGGTVLDRSFATGGFGGATLGRRHPSTATFFCHNNFLFLFV